MSILACPVCGTEYESWSTKCLNCGVALVGFEDIDLRELPEQDKVVYEVGAWPIDLQAAAAQVLAESEIPHLWEGTDLVVHVQFEDQVDALLDAIEQEAGLESAGDEGDEDEDVAGDEDEGDEDEGDEDGDEDDEEGEEGDLLAYTLDEWRPDERARLSALLEEAGVAYRWEDEVTLLVDDEHEAVVEQLLDRVEYPDELSADGDLPAVDEVDADPALLGTMFLAADRLKGNPLDASGLADLITAVDEADADVPPYGFDKALWRSLVERADELADLVADEEADRGDEVVAKATELRDLLRPFV